MSIFSLKNKPNGQPSRPLDLPTQVTVRTEMIGRSNAGKTALRLATAKDVANSFLPSGLILSGGDPMKVAQMLQEEAEVEEDLQHNDIPSTLVETLIEYELCEGDEPRVLWRTQEVIGQILTQTTPDSPAEQQKIYRNYLGRLSQGNTLIVVVPSPDPNSTAAELEVFRRDLKITTAFLREALKQRDTPRPCSVAIGLSKVDTLFESAEAARHELPDEILRDALKPLVTTVQTSKNVSDAVIVPFSSFGWQNAVRSFQDGRSSETGWLLREDASMQPYNVDALMIWTLMTGMLHQDVNETGDGEPALARVYRMLADDLQAIGSWLVPVKGPRIF